MTSTDSEDWTLNDFSVREQYTMSAKKECARRLFLDGDGNCRRWDFAEIKVKMDE